MIWNPDHPPGSGATMPPEVAPGFDYRGRLGFVPCVCSWDLSHHTKDCVSTRNLHHNGSVFKNSTVFICARVDEDKVSWFHFSERAAQVLNVDILICIICADIGFAMNIQADRSMNSLI